MSVQSVTIRSQLADLPSIVLDAWEALGIQTLLPIQSLAFASDYLQSSSCLVIGPTSCGKTFVGEVACVRHALQGRKCLYLVPFKALAEEKAVDFAEKYGREQVGARIIVSTADHRDQDRRLGDGDFDIAILTYEKLSSLMIQHPGLIRSVGALVVDEVQMVSDDGRGAELELLLTRCRQIVPNLQIIGLSAVVSELHGFDTWLKATVIKHDGRPVTLREGVVSRTGKFQYMEWGDGTRRSNAEQLSPLRGDDESDLAVNLVLQLLRSSSDQILVFARTIAETRSVARQIAAACSNLGPASKSIQRLAAIEESESVAALSETLAHSTAFHNGDLTLEERLAVETGFRTQEIRCVVSTSTLSMGVNLPASVVVIVKPTKWTKDASGSWLEAPLTVAEYRNMSGRAGRFGLTTDKFGTSYLIANSPLEQQSLLNRYVSGTPEPLISVFASQSLDILLLRCIASGLCRTTDGSRRFLLRTFAAQQSWNDDASRQGLDKKIQEAVRILREYMLIEDVPGEKFDATSLGRTCASSGLSIPTFVLLLSFAKNRRLSPVDLALLASSSSDAGINSTRIALSTDEYKGRSRHFVDSLRDICNLVASPETEMFLDELPTLGLPTYDDTKLLKFVNVAVAYIQGVASREIENRLGVSAGRIRAVGTNCSWLADTAASIAWCLGMADEAKAYERLADRFLYGCTDAALILACVPSSLHRAEREHLVENGYGSLQKIIESFATEIARKARVNLVRLKTLQKNIVALFGSTLDLEKNQASRLTAMGIAVAPIEELYAMTGTALEQSIESLLVPPFCRLFVSRFTKQRHGEPDLRIVLSDGRTGIAQITAKEKPTDLVGVTKATSIIQQAPELSPEVFICFGRPDFDKDAIKNAKAFARNGRNFKLIPTSVLAEMYVRFQEGKLSAERVAEILEKETGHITLDRI